MGHGVSNIQNIEVSKVFVTSRKRAINPASVADLQRSIEQQGLLQPIGVRLDGDSYQLIFGAHRLSAFQELGRDTIPAMVFPSEMTDEECLLAEIQENLARNDLTGAERKAFAAEVGRLLAKMIENGQYDEMANGQNDKGGQWLVEMANSTGTPFKTLQNWWKAFTKATGRNITPKQASAEDKSAFFDWLEEAREKAEAEKAEKVREAEEERLKKEAEAKQKRIDDEREALEKYLNDTARMFSREMVKDWLYQWIEAD